MQTIKALIIDDEINNCQNLKNILSRYCSEVEIIGIAHNATDGLELILSKKPELIFLDIRMPDGSGFDLLESIKKPTFDVIFVTAYDQYVIKAIRKSAIDYLLKPVNIFDLKEAVTRAIDKRNHHLENNAILQNYLDNSKRDAIHKKIALPTAERVVFVTINEIIRCQGENNYTHFFFIDGNKLLVSKTLKEYEELLSEDGFLRVHQSHLVNKNHVKSYEKHDGGYLKMIDNSSVSISRQRKDYVLKNLN